MAALNANGISNPGQQLSSGLRDKQFLTVFAGEVLTAFTRSSVMMGRHMVRTIQHGKAASFPVMGRAKAQYLAPGDNLDDQRRKMEHNERTIAIDGLLTADVLITDIDEAMTHYDVRTEYSKQLGEALGISADIAVINELANTASKSNPFNKGNIPTTEGIEGTGTSFELTTGMPEAMSKEFGQKILDALIAARAQFTKNNVPNSERYCLLSPDAYSALIMALMPNAANYQALFEPTTGKLMNVAGFEIIETAHFHNSGASGKHTLASDVQTAGLQGIIFHRSAVGTVKLKDLAMERARRPEYQADQIIAKYAMGHGGLRPEAVGLILQNAQE